MSPANDDRIRVNPIRSPHPGELVNEYLEFHGWSQRDLARRTSLTPMTISKICNRRASIKPDTAVELEKVFHRPANFWINLQRQFDETSVQNSVVVLLLEWLEVVISILPWR